MKWSDTLLMIKEKLIALKFVVCHWADRQTVDANLAAAEFCYDETLKAEEIILFMQHDIGKVLSLFQKDARVDSAQLNYKLSRMGDEIWMLESWYEELQTSVIGLWEKEMEEVNLKAGRVAPR